MFQNGWAVISACVRRHLDASGNAEHFPTDKARIFARAISNAMPWEKVDICISRQAL